MGPIQATVPEVPGTFWERCFCALLTRLLEATLSYAPREEGRRELVAPGLAEGYLCAHKGELASG